MDPVFADAILKKVLILFLYLRECTLFKGRFIEANKMYDQINPNNAITYFSKGFRFISFLNMKIRIYK